MHQLLGTNAIFTQSGHAWKSSRALLKPAFDKASIADLDRLELFFLQFRNRISSSLSEAGTIELQSLLQKLTMDSSADFLLGSPVGALQEANNPSVNAATFTESFDIAQQVIVTRWLLNHLFWLYNPPHFRAACSVVHQQVQKFVQKALTKPKNEKRYIFTEALAEATQDAKVIQDQVLSVMLAGRDTTASLLAWTVLSLSRNPEVLGKLRAAVATAVGVGASAKIPTQEELRGITYLKWVLHEVLRLYPPVYANTRCAAKATTLPYGGGKDGQNPIALKKGERVVASFFGLMRRKDLYGEDADEFRPERWGEEQLRKIGWGWVPFNGGPRICLGRKFLDVYKGFGEMRLIWGI
jgi:cytochrome P450